MQYWWRQANPQTMLMALGLVFWTGLLLILCYRFPVDQVLRTNGLGDQWFVQTTEAQRDWASHDGYVYPDELDATGQRFRWTRGRVLVELGGLGQTPADVVFELTGWPTDTLHTDLAQPILHVLANDVPVGAVTLTPQRDTYRFHVPALAPDVQLDLRLGAFADSIPTPENTAYFTATNRYPQERRPLGMRFYSVQVQAQGASWIWPDVTVLWWGLGLVGLSLMAARRWRTGMLLGMLISGSLALVVTWARLWIIPMLTVLTVPLVLWALWNWRAGLTSFWLHWRQGLGRSVVWRWSVGAVAVLASVLLSVPALLNVLSTVSVEQSFTTNMVANAVIILSLTGAIVGLLLIRWSELCLLLERANLRIRTRQWPGLILLGSILVIWIFYMLGVIRSIPYLGSADYADNGVVARNLVAGRGWVVDYVTQFYALTPDGNVTRVQETWPLLQPVLIAPFFKLFGASAWVAKIPNLLALLALVLLIYRVAEYLWDRRVGLVAVVLLLLNQHYFRLQIYSTSDLSFALWYGLALWLAWRAQQEHQRRDWVLSGICIGLMCLQKPSGVLLAIGMGVWMIWKTWPLAERWMFFRTQILWWIIPALLVFSPYMLRNLYEFGTPMHSTETYDAWVLEYPGTGEPWEQIYSVMTPQGGISETGGLPERSWILRWGFQRTYAKIERQVLAVRNYFFPYHEALGPFAGKGELMGNLALGYESDPSRWLMAGAWLALLGVALLRRKQAHFAGLIGWSFVPYTLFLIFYWHANEQRYFVPFIPWLCIAAGAGIWAIHDSIAAVARGRLRPIAAVVVLLLVTLAVQPGWVEAQNKTAPTGQFADWQADLAAFEWLRTNTPADAVVMTRVPWQLQFHAERPAVMNPYTADLTMLLRIAKYYNARYLMVNAITNNKGVARQALGGLLDGREAAGFRRVAAFKAPAGRTIYIYEFPADYNNVAPIDAVGQN